MMLTTTDYVPGKKVANILGVVRGSTVQTRHIGSNVQWDNSSGNLQEVPIIQHCAVFDRDVKFGASSEIQFFNLTINLMRIFKTEE